MAEYFKSKPLQIKFKESDIDAENGIIKNVVMLQAGEAKGHGVHLEAEFVRNVIAYDVKHYSNTGIKACFGHPALSDTTMGKQMGYFKNFRYDDKRQAGLADLHLLESANLSPDKPNMRNWMLSMAKESPNFVMSSIVFNNSGLYHYNKEGERVEGASEDDTVTFVAFDEADGAKHLYTDIVEQGAATDTLFAANFNKDKFAVQAVAFLQEHEAIHTFLKGNPNKLIEFAEKAGIVLPTKSLSALDHLKGIFGAKQIDFNEAIAAETQQQITDLETELAARTASFASKESEYTAQITALNTRIAKLEKMPGEEELHVAPEPAIAPTTTDKDLIFNSPLSRAARGEIDLNDFE